MPDTERTRVPDNRSDVLKASLTPRVLVSRTQKRGRCCIRHHSNTHTHTHTNTHQQHTHTQTHTHQQHTHTHTYITATHTHTLTRTHAYTLIHTHSNKHTPQKHTHKWPLHVTIIHGSALSSTPSLISHTVSVDAKNKKNSPPLYPTRSYNSWWPWSNSRSQGCLERKTTTCSSMCGHYISRSQLLSEPATRDSGLYS